MRRSEIPNTGLGRYNISRTNRGRPAQKKMPITRVEDFRLWERVCDTMITIIGRGHSGTRAIAETLQASGVFMGSPLNPAGDLLPPWPMYEACREMARFVRWRGGLEWDFSALHEMEIPIRFQELIHEYLKSVLNSSAEDRGWKIPETTLVFPWIRRLFPNAKYIFWIRDARDSIVASHVTDDLRDFGIAYPETRDERRRRAVSWKYQLDIVKATPKPTHWIEVRFEDFVLRQGATLALLEEFLGIELTKIPVREDSVGRWKSDRQASYFGFLGPPMREYGYDVPGPLTALVPPWLSYAARPQGLAREIFSRLRRLGTAPVPHQPAEATYWMRKRQRK